MYFFFHLFTGLIIGLLIADILHDRRWILACALGSVLPDLIDKPLGHILFANSISYGRIYCHTLAFFLILLVAGIILWHERKNILLLGVAAGVISHQVLDLMWERPANWFWPVLGPFQGKLPADYMLTLIKAELQNPVEIAAAAILGIAALVYLKYRNRIPGSDTGRAMLKNAAILAALGLFVLGGVILGSALAGDPLPVPGWDGQGEAVISGIVLLLAGIAAWRFFEKIPTGAAKQGSN